MTAQILQERLTSSAVSHRVSTLHPYNTLALSTLQGGTQTVLGKFRDTGQVCSHMPPRKRKDPAQPSLEAVTDEPVKTKTSRKGKLDQPVVQVQVTSLRHESLGPRAEALMTSAGTGWCKGRAFQEAESSQDWTALLTQRHWQSRPSCGGHQAWPAGHCRKELGQAGRGSQHVWCLNRDQQGTSAHAVGGSCCRA